MKFKAIISATIIFLLLVNTSYYWEGKLELYAFPAFAILAGAFLVLSIILFRQLFFAVKEKFSNKKRLLVIFLLTVVLLLAYCKPMGIIDFDSLEGKDLLVAEREGSANCLTTFKLKDNQKFVEKGFCFGAYEVKGTYWVKNDTIYLEHIKFGREQGDIYQFAVIKPFILGNGEIKHHLIKYKNKQDTSGYLLWITKNELVKAQ